MEQLAALWSIISLSPFLLTMAASFCLVYIFRRIMRLYWPDFESNRWFKTFLPVGLLAVAIAISIGLSFVPAFPLFWAIALIQGFVAGTVVLAGYGFIRNYVRERAKEILRKSTTPPAE